MKKYAPGEPGYRTALVTGVVVRIIFSLITYGLMLWAASEVSGVLRWALLGWVGLNLFIVLASASTQMAKREVTR